MDSSEAININKSIKELLDQLKQEILESKDSINKTDFTYLNKRLNKLDDIYKQLNLKSNSDNTVSALLKAQTALQENQTNLIAQINNTTDNIWSVDRDLNIKTLNNNFSASYKTAFGVQLKEGINVLVSLPEPLVAVWKDRYQRAIKGEQFSIVDKFDIEGIPMYTETSFNPIIINDEIVGIACFSRDITKQKESEAKFKLLSEVSPNAISIVSENRFIYVNKAWEELFGYSVDEAYNSNIDIVLAEEDRKNSIENLEKFIKDKNSSNRVTTKVRTKKGVSKLIDVASTVIKFENKNALLSVSTDLTELLHLQEELKRNRANLISQIENTDDRIWSIDSNKNIVTINSNFKNDFKTAFNIDLKEGVSALDGLPSPIKEVWDERYKKVLSGKSYNLIEEFQIENIPQFVEVSFNPIWLDKEVVGATCYSRDISERRIAEIALKESEQRFKTLVDNIPSTTYRCTFDEHYTMEYISDEITKLTGYPASDFLNNKVRSFSSIIYEDDLDLVAKAIQEGVEKKKSYRIEYRVKHKNGTLRWVHERGRCQFNSEGQVLWLDGVISDTTERKQSEAALRESEEQYRAIFNSMSDVFVRTNLDGTILIVTPSIIDLFGYTPKEVIGMSILNFYKEPNKRSQLISILSEKGFVRDFETVFLSKNKEEKTISINAKLLINNEGQPYAMETIARDITYKRIAEKAIEERTQELDSIFENAPIILLLVDSEGRVLNINRAGLQNNEKDKSQLLSLLGGEVLKCANTIRTGIPCGLGKKCKDCSIRNSIIKTFDTKQNQNQIKGSLTIVKDGVEMERRFLISTTYIEFETDTRVLLSLDDITEMHNAEEEIRRLSAAVKQSNATVVITKVNGDIEYVNPQFEKSTGYKASEVIGQNPRILKSHQKSSEDYKEMWETILNGETWQGEFLNIRKNKSEYWERAIITPITNDEGAITSFIAIKEDITANRKTQQELIRSEKELRELNDEKSRYFSILAHDLRGLVGSFHAYSELIRSHFEEFTLDDLKEQIETLTKASGESLTLLDNLLTWGKTTQGRLTLDIEKINIHLETTNVLELLKDIASNKKINLINNIPENTYLNTDANVFKTIIRNLTNNAIKFTPEGGSITIEARKTPAKLMEVSVIDTGMGIDEETIGKLFKLGEKVVRKGTNEENGTGLGLIICKEMVKKLKGSINVESEPEKGSRFYFRVPL